MKIIVKGAGMLNIIMEEEAQMGGVLTVVKVGRDKAGKGVGCGMSKCLLDTLSAGVEDLCQLLIFAGVPLP